MKPQAQPNPQLRCAYCGAHLAPEHFRPTSACSPTGQSPPLPWPTAAELEEAERYFICRYGDLAIGKIFAEGRRHRLWEDLAEVARRDAAAAETDDQRAHLLRLHAEWLARSTKGTADRSGTARGHFDYDRAEGT